MEMVNVIGLETKKKRGRKKKDEIKDKKEIKDQNKFIIDVNRNAEEKELILNVLRQANEKDFGREIQLKDILILLLSKLNVKDIEKLQENCLTDRERIRKAHIEFNKKNNTELSFDEFLIKRLGIS
jgi:hypothetical protein